MHTIIFPKLNSVIHSPLRLAIMNILHGKKEADFVFLKERTNSTVGNLSIQIGKLKKEGYIQVSKQFKDNYPQTICTITPKGVEAFTEYGKAMQAYLTSHKA
ncbi:transcriptional regulator [Ferruginibacter lapsinanis]|uniref:winged helix-turn-helix domain-containing protein n=1 Tax=Ferruginibacter lapsinanis TaxID=563172 RepID=UPI001E50DA58|nr:transcriptional regulator [Ferruginibacter lapsinanis]UEG51080.1 transcriptional regulator [Ferruginibacter lapsinanis]